MFWYTDGFQCAAILLRANDTNNPVLESLTGRCEVRFYCADHPRTLRFAAVEDLHVNPFRAGRQSPRAPSSIRHKGSRSTKVNVRFSRYADRFEHRSRQMTGGIEILTQLVERSRFAVADIAAALRKASSRRRTSAAKGCCSRSRAAWSHKTCRADRAAANTWIIANTGCRPDPGAEEDD